MKFSVRNFSLAWMKSWNYGVVFCMMLHSSSLTTARTENPDLQSVPKHRIRVLKSHVLDKHRSVSRNIWIFQDSSS